MAKWASKIFAGLFSKERELEVSSPSSEKLLSQIDKQKIPGHIAIIMDGNGRWAGERGLKRSAGHRFGTETLRLIVEQSRGLGIKYLTVFAFSTENWKRPEEEVWLLMSLLDEFLDKETMNLHRQGIKLNFIGQWRELAPSLVAKICRYMEVTAQNEQMTLNIAVNYGGRQELLLAARRLAAEVVGGTLTPEQIDEATFSAKLDTAGMPDPDLLIRPSGEQRISNFLLWQMAYTEFYYTNIYWPDFDKEQLLLAILEYQKRSRRYGGLKNREK